MKEIVPVHLIKRRVPEQGRIRMGVKQLTGKLDKNNKPMSRPVKLSRLRFTSQDRGALDVIAAKYGGEVTPWPEGPTDGQFQVTVTQEKVPIALPPDPLSGTPIYEHWSGGGCLRRCDGVDCAIPAADAEEQQAIIPCPCRAENRMACKPRTRLNVVLREVPFGGTWRLESTGWNAAEELPAQVDTVLALQNANFPKAELSIQHRTRLVGGQTKKFIVPYMSWPESLEEIAAGAIRMSALGKVRELQNDLAALPAGSSDEPAVVDAPDWIDAEAVDDAELVDEGTEPPADAETIAPAPAPPKRRTQSPRVKALHAGVRQLIDVPDVSQHLTSPKITEASDQLRHGLVLLVTKGRSSSTSETNDAEEAEMLNLVGEILAGDRRLLGFGDDGRVRVSGKRTE